VIVVVVVVVVDDTTLKTCCPSVSVAVLLFGSLLLWAAGFE
jgi:hypothetical protein